MFRQVAHGPSAAQGLWGTVLQVAGSALAFGLRACRSGGLVRGSLRGARGRHATATGWASAWRWALVYLASHRIVLPCIVAHFLINLLIEPGLVLAAVRGRIRQRLRSQCVMLTQTRVPATCAKNGPALLPAHWLS